MNWIRVFGHDIRCGVFRWRYLLCPLLVVMECLTLAKYASFSDVAPSFGDMALYLFQGKPPSANRDLDIPLSWLLILGGILLMELDYMLYDLTNAGTQVIVRSRSRTEWFLGKCLWNVLSVAVCFLIIYLTAALTSLSFGGDLSLTVHAELKPYIFKMFSDAAPTSRQVLAMGVLAPFATVAALSMLQMTLCLFVKPVISFLICQAQIIIALFWKSPFCLGIGAMVLKSDWVATDDFGPEYAGVSTWACTAFSLAVIAVCVAAGVIRFRRTDILGLEE